jgi:hypothetical protein
MKCIDPDIKSQRVFNKILRMRILRRIDIRYHSNEYMEYTIYVSEWVSRWVSEWVSEWICYLMSDWVSECVHCLKPSDHLFSYIMERTSFMSMRWWSCPFCTRTILLCRIIVTSVRALKQEHTHRHVFIPLNDMCLAVNKSGEVPF